MSAEWCYDCGEEFRDDDTGGYNPPCRCTFKCRSCCEADCERDVTEDSGDPRIITADPALASLYGEPQT